MANIIKPHIQGRVWDYYKPRHTHSWNMLVLAWRALDQLDSQTDVGFEVEYIWENFILRLWVYRTTVKTLSKLEIVRDDTHKALKKFDTVFEIKGINGLKALRDMIAHFDDYAAGIGRGPAIREKDLDPFRTFTQDQYEKGSFLLDRVRTYDAAVALRNDAKEISDKFITWYNAEIS